MFFTTCLISLLFFFFLQIVPTLGVHFIVAWFLTLFLDFSLGKRVHHVPLGSLKCSRLGRRTLSWEQNRSLKKRDKIHFFQGLFLTWLTYSFIENTIAGSALSLSKENYTLLSEAMCHCSQSRCFLPGMWGLTDQDIPPSVSLHPLVYLTSPVVTVCRQKRTSKSEASGSS